MVYIELLTYTAISVQSPDINLQLALISNKPFNILSASPTLQKVEQDQDNDRGVVAALSHGNSGSHLLKCYVVLPILNIYSVSL